MLVKKEVDFHEFKSWFQKSQYKKNFNDIQLRMLFDEMENLEDEEGINPYGDDIIAICCDYSGLTKEELINDYGYLFDLKNNYDNYLSDLIQCLEERTTIISDEEEENFIVLNF